MSGSTSGENCDLKVDNSSPIRSTPQRTSQNIFNNDSPLKTSEPLAMNTPRKGASSRVIESLHGEIDELKSEIAKVKNANEEFKKTNEVLKKRRDQLMEQLSNVKHENDTINSLLQRKQRRITDLEEQLSESIGSTDDLKFKMSNLQARYNALEENQNSLTSELERLKISYETIVTSQKEYRSHYATEIKQLKERLHAFTKEKQAEITKNMGLINKSDATIYRSIKSITLRSIELENKYAKRDEELTQKLTSLKELHEKNDYDVNELLHLAQSIFGEISTRLGLDSNELLQEFLKKPIESKPVVSKEEDHVELGSLPTPVSTPLPISNASEETIGDNTKTTPVITPAQSSATEKESPSQITVLKRQEKATSIPSASSSENITKASVEERITSTSRELNDLIPPTDRKTSIDGSLIAKGKTVKSSPKNVSNTAASATSRISSKNSSRRSSKIFDTVNDLGETGPTTRNPSLNGCDVNVGNSEELTETAGSTPSTRRKRKRNRKRKGKKATSTTDEVVDQSFDADSGNESH